MYSSSSKRNSLNSDGSRVIRCYQCGQALTKTFLPVTKALCIMCQRAFDGEPISPEAIQAYEASRVDITDVSMLVLPEEPEAVRKFSLSSMAGGFIRAIGLPRIFPVENTKSKETSRSKRRGSLFSSMDLGSMESVDSQLNTKE